MRRFPSRTHPRNTGGNCWWFHRSCLQAGTAMDKPLWARSKNFSSIGRCAGFGVFEPMQHSVVGSDKQNPGSRSFGSQEGGVGRTTCRKQRIPTVQPVPYENRIRIDEIPEYSITGPEQTCRTFIASISAQEIHEGICKGCCDRTKCRPTRCTESGPGETDSPAR